MSNYLVNRTFTVHFNPLALMCLYRYTVSHGANISSAAYMHWYVTSSLGLFRS